MMSRVRVLARASMHRQISRSLSKSTLRHVEIVPVSMSALLAVVITDTGRVAQHLLAVNVMPHTDELARFCTRVNAVCDGQTLAQAARITRDMITDPQWQPMRQLAESLAGAFASMADDERTSELYMAGTSRLAHQRTLADLAPLFDALEEQVVLMKLMSALSEEVHENGVSVAIGSETHTPGLLHASVVTSGYGRIDTAAGEPDADGTAERPEGSEPVAFVGSIGPTHMDYATTMAAVRAVARYLTAFLAHDGPATHS